MSEREDDEQLTPEEEKAQDVMFLETLGRARQQGHCRIGIEARIETLRDGKVVESRAVPVTRSVPVVEDHTSKPQADLERGRALGVDGFVAVDFETATSSRASACAVAVATVNAGKVEQIKRWLIRPPDNEYDGFNIAIHGITPDMTAASDSIVEIWPDVLAFIGDRPLVAHYAAFDMSVLRSSLTAYGGDWPDLIYFCTRALSRAAWPGRLSYRLTDIASSCGLAFHHHEPGADAKAAAEITIACCGRVGQCLLPDASRALRVSSGSLKRDGWTPSGIRPLCQRLADMQPTVDEVPPDGPFVGRIVVFTETLTSSVTRAQAAQLVVNAGGRVANSISKKVDYLVLGQQDAGRVEDGVHSSKMLKADELLRSGGTIELLAEDDFFRMLPA